VPLDLTSITVLSAALHKDWGKGNHLEVTEFKACPSAGDWLPDPPSIRWKGIRRSIQSLRRVSDDVPPVKVCRKTLAESGCP